MKEEGKKKIFSFVKERLSFLPCNKIEEKKMPQHNLSIIKSKMWELCRKLNHPKRLSTEGGSVRDILRVLRVCNLRNWRLSKAVQEVLTRELMLVA